MLMKNLISLLFIITCIYSCKKEENKDGKFFTRMKELNKIPKDSLGILSTQTYYYLDTISIDTVKTKLKFKNVSKNKIKGFAIEPTCDCTIINKKVQTIIFPQDEYYISLKLDLSDTKGYFSKSLIIYGSFYPYYRNVVIEGYKK